MNKIWGIRKNLWNETKKCYEELQDPFSPYQLEKMKVSLDEMVRLASAIVVSMEIAEDFYNKLTIRSETEKLIKNENISPCAKVLLMELSERLMEKEKK